LGSCAHKTLQKKKLDSIISKLKNDELNLEDMKVLQEIAANDPNLLETALANSPLTKESIELMNNIKQKDLINEQNNSPDLTPISDTVLKEQQI